MGVAGQGCPVSNAGVENGHKSWLPSARVRFRRCEQSRSRQSHNCVQRRPSSHSIQSRIVLTPVMWTSIQTDCCLHISVASTSKSTAIVTNSRFGEKEHQKANNCYIDSSLARGGTNRHYNNPFRKHSRHHSSNFTNTDTPGNDFLHIRQPSQIIPIRRPLEISPLRNINPRLPEIILGTKIHITINFKITTDAGIR